MARLREPLEDFVMPYSIRPLDLDRILNDVLDDVRPPDDVQITCNIPKLARAPVSDRLVVRKVFENIIRNSCEAIGKAGGEVSVDAYEDEKSGPVIVRFSDTGPGIADSVKGRLFQGIASTKEGCHGMGLLASAAALRSLGADIRIAEGVTRGAAIEVILPT
jgi:C4-dicarboxylate-specific signal transduction histidine kinase